MSTIITIKTIDIIMVIIKTVTKEKIIITTKVIIDKIIITATIVNMKEKITATQINAEKDAVSLDFSVAGKKR